MKPEGIPGGLRAVVCDDDPLVLRIVTAVLRRKGYDQVERTSSALEAVDLAEAIQPDVVVLDLNLEGESGLAAIPKLKGVAPDSPIVVFSGAQAMKTPARHAGAFAVLPKISMSSLDDLERVLAEVGRGAPSWSGNDP
jgi:CheY-like chemotaxis protein